MRHATLLLLLLICGCINSTVTIIINPRPCDGPATRPAAAATTAPPAAQAPAAPVIPIRIAKWTPAKYPDDQVNLIAMGDWGADTDRQKLVAQSMASYVGASRTAFNALVTLGDNYYVSIKGTNDPKLQKLFEDMYDSTRLNFPFYATLGNHDYEQDRSRMELAYPADHPDSRWKMPARWYRLEMPQSNPLVTVLMLDSNKSAMSKEDWAAQLAWLDAELAKPRAKWTVCCAHHPLFANGAHGDSPTLQKEWGPLFRKHKVDFYVAGHDHSLQHMEVRGWPTSFVVSGGGGALRTDVKRKNHMLYGAKLYGFAHMQFTAQTATVKYIDGLNQNVVHQFTRQPGGKIAIAPTTRPTTQTAQGAAPTTEPGTSTTTATTDTPQPSVNRIANAMLASGEDYDQMETVLSLSGEMLQKYKARLQDRDTAYDQWAKSPAGIRYTQLGADLAAARRERDAAKVAELDGQYQKARAEQTAVRRDLRKQFNGGFSETQLRQWAGHMLYLKVIEQFKDDNLSEEQKQQAYAICAILGGQSATPEAIDKDPYLTPDAALVSQATKAINDYVLGIDPLMN